MKLASILSILFFVFFQTKDDSSSSYSTKAGKVILFFDLTVGQMNASTNKANSTLDIQTDAVLFNMKVRSFEFSNPILEQQFKEVYMEVDKYPETTFVGKFKEKINFKIKTPQKVNVVGTLGMHGITVPKTIPATITIDGDKVKIVSTFMVRASEHKIEIPAAFFASGKDEIKVTLDALYTKDTK